MPKLSPKRRTGRRAGGIDHASTQRHGSRGGVRFLLLTLVVGLAALAAATSQSQAQSCQRTEHLGTLQSYQTIQRLALLNSSSCRLNGTQYYDYYDFELSGAGEISFSLRSQDIGEQIVLNTISGEHLAGHRSPPNYPAQLSRTLPAGAYRVLAVSYGTRQAGSYTLTIETGQLAAPPPPPPPETTTDVDQDDERVPPPDNTEDTEVVRGYVLARVHPLPENDRRGAYRVEFGFLSEEVLASGSDRTAVVEANEHLLPPRRYLNEASMLERARDNNRRWLHSSPIDVFPLEGDDATLSGEPLLTGRVIARWNPTAGGRFRIEFGFLPEEAIEAAGGDTQKAAEACADLLPDPGRYLSESRINSEARRSAPRWLTSSLVEIGGEDDCKPVGAVTITPIAVPLTLPRSEVSDESIAIIRGDLGDTFTPVAVEGLPPGLEWDLAETSADGREHQLTVSGTISSSAAARDYSVSITAEGADGEPTTETIRIVLGPMPPVIMWGGYDPATTSVGGSVRILQPRVTSPIPPPPSVTWEFTTPTTNICTVHRTTGALTLLAVGACQVRVTASAAGYGDGTASAQVTVSPDPIPVISWSGYARNSVEFGDAAPTLVRPTATVNGRPIDPEFRYSVAPVSATVCSVNEVTGALTIRAAGTCTINLSNLPGTGYGVGSASASVTVNPGGGTPFWDGYSQSSVRLGETPPRPLQPRAAAPTIEFSYRSLTPSICSADRQSAALTLVAAGTCIVQVTTSGDPNYRSASETATVTVRPPVVAPVVDVTCSPREPEVDAVVTCRYHLVSGDEPEEWDWRVSGSGANPSRGDRETFVTRFSSEGMRTVSLEASNDGGSGRDSATVTVPDNEPPTCSRPSPRSVSMEDDGRGSVYVNCTDPDGDRLTVTPVSSNTGIVTIDRDSANPWVYVSGVSEGSATVTVTASDGKATSAPQTFSVTVTGGNGSPVCDIHSSVQLTLEVGGPGASMGIVDVCTDPDGDTLRFTARSSSPSVVSVSDPSGSRADYSITAVGPGTATITVSATDPDGLSDSASFPVTVTGGVKPPDIRISCSPSSIEEGGSVTCRARNRGGAIDTYSWSDSDGGSGSSSSYRTSFSSSGTKTVSLTARNTAGPDSDDTTVRVRRPDVKPPRINSVTCSPLTEVNSQSQPRLRTEGGSSIRCTASTSGQVTTWAWSGVGSGGAATYSARLNSLGPQTIRLTVSNSGGRDESGPIDFQVVARTTYTYARCGSDAIRVYWFNRSRLGKHWLNMTWEQVQDRVPGWGEHLIGRLSQAECNSWLDEPPITYDTWTNDWS